MIELELLEVGVKDASTSVLKTAACGSLEGCSVVPSFEQCILSHRALLPTAMRSLAPGFHIADVPRDYGLYYFPFHSLLFFPVSEFLIYSFDKKVDYACTPEEVQQHFQSCGTVNRVTILTDKFGQPKGFAYVEFVETEAVQEALLLNESELHGRQLKVLPKRTNVPGMKQYRPRRFNPYMAYRFRRPYPPPHFYSPYGYGKVPRFRRPGRFMPYY